MSEISSDSILILAGFILAAGVFIALLFVDAPYGRHNRRGWGVPISSNLGWLIMEAPAAVFFGLSFLSGSAPRSIVLWVFLGMWEAHYIHRAFIYPFQLSDGRKKMPFTVVFFGLLFNVANAYLNGHYLFSMSGGYPDAWLGDPRFILGACLFIAGFILNRWADRTLRTLRRPGELGYRIPYGGLYRWISCPNYLGEIVEWAGWAIATWSLPGLFFLVWTISNLAPRARSHHAWYQKEFENYPKERKALIPGLW